MIGGGDSVQKFLIVGGNRLKGTIRASGSKNATLPVLAACILNASKNIIHEVPKLKDVLVMKDVLTHLGLKGDLPGQHAYRRQLQHPVC